MIKFISDIEHYDIVLNLAAKARRTLGSVLLISRIFT